MNNNKILSDVNGNMAELLQLISSLNNEQLNMIPFEGSWTAGQLATHVLMSCSGFVQMLNGPVKETNRAPDEGIEKIKSSFLDFSTKMKSPAFVVPPDTASDKEDLLHSLKDQWSGIDQAIETLELEKTCLAFELPGLGFLTRLEAIYFVNYHTQRHIHQLKNICKKLPGVKTLPQAQ
jgi:DinB superfamily